MIKRTLKVTIAATIYYMGLLPFRDKWLAGNVKLGNYMILMYHRVMPSDIKAKDIKPWMHIKSHPGIVVSCDMFDAQMRYLNDHYDVISLEELCKKINKYESIPRRTVVITFDDAWRDNYVYAYPVLKKYNLPATIFIPTGFIDSSNVFWPERLINYFKKEEVINAQTLERLSKIVAPETYALLDKLGPKNIKSKSEYYVTHLIKYMKYLAPQDRNAILDIILGHDPEDDNMDDASRILLSWKEISEMKDYNIDFGSHCVNHEILTMIDGDDQAYELKESFNILQERLKMPSMSLAYPNGNYDDNIKKMAKQVGYYCALTTNVMRESNDDDIYSLNRINVHDGFCRGLFGGFSKARFFCHIHGLLS